MRAGRIDGTLWQLPDAALWQFSGQYCGNFRQTPLVGPSLPAAVTARTTAATMRVGAVSD
jgi:hypothetical protein